MTSIFDEEDNNPFAGSSHLFASGIRGDVESLESGFDGSAAKFGDVNSNSSDNNNSPNNGNNYMGYRENDENKDQEYGQFDSHETSFDTTTSSPSSWDNYNRAASNRLGMEGSIIDISKQQEYDRGLIDQANSTVSTADPLAYYSGGDQVVKDVMMDDNAVVDIPSVIQLKKKNKVVIVYIVKVAQIEVRRRYSDFDRLRSLLSRLYPTLLLPSLPEKHSFANYVRSPLNVQKSDVKFIEHRKRALCCFLNTIISYPNYNPLIPSELPPIKLNDVFLKFLDPSVSDFSDSLKLLPSTALQSNSLLNHPLNPYRISPYHSLLPPLGHHAAANYDAAVRSYLAVLEREKRQRTELSQKIDIQPSDGFDMNAQIDIFTFEDYGYFKQMEKYIATFSRALRPIIDTESKLHTNFDDLVRNLSKLGAYFNAFSLEYNLTMSFQPEFDVGDSTAVSPEKFDDLDDAPLQLKKNMQNHQNSDFEQFYTLASAIEKVGQSIDNEFLNFEMLEYQLTLSFSEPLVELNSMLKNCLTEVVRFKKLKDLQYLTISKRLREKRKQLKNILDVDLRYQRLSEVLKNNVNESNTMKQAYQRLEIQKQKQLIKQQRQLSRNSSFSRLGSKTVSRKPSTSTMTSHDADNVSDRSFDHAESFNENDFSDMHSEILNEDILTLSTTSSSSFSWLKLFTGKAHNPEGMTKMQRNSEIKKLKKEILSLQQLAKVVADDAYDVSESLKINFKTLVKYSKVKITNLNLQFTKILLKFLRENLGHWLKVSEHISNNIYDLKFSIQYDSRIPRYVRFPGLSKSSYNVVANRYPSQSYDQQDSVGTSSNMVRGNDLESEIQRHNNTVSTAIVHHIDPQVASKGFLDQHDDDYGEEDDDDDESDVTSKEGDDATFGFGAFNNDSDGEWN